MFLLMIYFGSERPGPGIKLPPSTFEPPAAPTPPMELDDKIKTTFGGRVDEPGRQTFSYSFLYFLQVFT